MGHIFRFAQMIKDLPAGMYQRLAAFKSFCVEPGLPQSENFATGPGGGNEDARSSPKVAIHDRFFPSEEAAQIVLGRCEVLRLIEVVRGNAV